MSDDDWVERAMKDDNMVVELLMQMQHAPRRRVTRQQQKALKVEWGQRRPRFQVEYIRPPSANGTHGQTSQDAAPNESKGSITEKAELGSTVASSSAAEEAKLEQPQEEGIAERVREVERQEMHVFLPDLNLPANEYRE